MEDIMVYVFILGLPILFLFFCIFMFIKTSKSSKKAKKEMQNKIADKNALFMSKMKHFNGLPISEGTMTDAFWCNDKIVFEANGTSYNLLLSKLTDVSENTDVEIQKQYVSSNGGAVAGAVMFGALGAMIGGRAKEKTTNTVTKYLIFTYVDNDEVKYIAFENAYNSKLFIEEFKK